MQHTCSVCGETKPISEFYVRKSSGKPYNYCKCCNSELGKAWRAEAKSKEKVLPDFVKCNCCGEEKSVDNFYSSSTALSGVDHRCKSCSIKRSIKWAKKNKDKIVLQSARRYAKHRDTIRVKVKAYSVEYTTRPKVKDRNRIKASHRRAIINGLAGTYTSADISILMEKQMGMCPYCGELLREYDIDHIIPVTREESSNFPSNLQLTCGPCNKSKRNKTHQEFVEYLRVTYPDKYEKYLKQVDKLETINLLTDWRL